MRVNDGATRATGTGEAGGSSQSSAAADAERAARAAQRAAEEAARAAAEAARAQAAQAAQAQARAEAAAKRAQDALKQAQAALAQAQKQNVPKGVLARVEQAVARANTASQQATTSARNAGSHATNASSFVPARPTTTVPTLQRQPPAGPPGVTPGYTREQAAKEATELHRAMKGGLTGWGTDEDAIFRTLDKRTPADIALIRQSFKEHYNLDLDSALRQELSGTDLTRVNSMLAGSKGNAGAAAIQQQMGWFGDKDAILRTLQPVHRPLLSADVREGPPRHQSLLVRGVHAQGAGAEPQRRPEDAAAQPAGHHLRHRPRAGESAGGQSRALQGA
jgi:hypothetical protein